MKYATVFTLALYFHFSICCCCHAQNTARELSRDYIYFKDGSFLKGIITDMSDKTGLHATSELGAQVYYDFCQIKKVIRKPPLLQLLDSSYVELGLTYGLPGILNFSAGIWFGRAGVRISGMYYNENFAAFQAHIGYKLQDNNRWRHSVGISYGRVGSTVDHGGIGYAGLVYNYSGPPMNISKKHHAWFAEIGYGRYFETGNETTKSEGSFGPLFQIGYLYRFIKHAPRYETIPIPKCPKPPKKKRVKPPKYKTKQIIVRPRLDKRKAPKPKPCPKCPEAEKCPDCPEALPCPECPNCPGTVDIDSIGSSTYQAQNIKVEQLAVVLRIRDSGIPDGDMVSMELNGEVILDQYTLTKTDFEIPINLIPDIDNILVLEALNMGKRKPNTSVITIVDRKKDKKIVLNADLDKPGAIRFLIGN